MTQHARRCRYCRELVGPARPATWDHLVPRWVLRSFPHVWRRKGAHWTAFFTVNRVTACFHCNKRKGSMPAVIFVDIRLDGPATKRERTRWDTIAAEFSKLRGKEAEAHSLAELVLREFGRPLPAHFPIGDRPVILAPADREPSGDWVKG